MKNKQLEPGIGTHVTLDRVIDGDTIVVSVRRTIPVRIRDLRCAEKNTEAGKIASSVLDSFLKNKELFLFVPSGQDLPLTDILTFNRVIGDLFADDIPVRDWMINNGFGKSGNKEGID